nr:uncharacterized mitochondrial protein AtMg00810-like [Tanacetum cinerariifolium]
TVNIGLWYMKDSGFELTGFSDADYAGCKDFFKSTSGGAQFLGEKLVSWSSKKQYCTTLSTVEAEYVSLSACCAQVLWMRTQLTDYGFHFGSPSRTSDRRTLTTCLIRNQLRSDGDMCLYALTVSTMEPKNVKEAMTDPAWIELMQEELLQFKRMDVWVLVPIPDNISPLTLK